MGFIMNETCDIIRFLLSDLEHFDDNLPLDIEHFNKELQIELLEMGIKYLKDENRRNVCKEMLKYVCW